MSIATVRTGVRPESGRNGAGRTLHGENRITRRSELDGHVYFSRSAPSVDGKLTKAQQIEHCYAQRQDQKYN